MKRDFNFWRERVSTVKERGRRRPPKYEETLNRLAKFNKSGSPPILMGRGESALYATLSELLNIYISGKIGTGKSSLKEFLMQKLIDWGLGFMLIDPSLGGDTMYRVLRYCVKKGYEKVLVIDPKHLYTFGKISYYNPLETKAGIAGVMNARLDRRSHKARL